MELVPGETADVTLTIHTYPTFFCPDQEQQNFSSKHSKVYSLVLDPWINQKKGWILVYRCSIPQSTEDAKKKIGLYCIVFPLKH